MFCPCFYTMWWSDFKSVYEWLEALWSIHVRLCVCVRSEWLGLLPGEGGRRSADDSRTVRRNDSREPEPRYAVHWRTKRKVSLRPHLECLSSCHLNQPGQLDCVLKSRALLCHCVFKGAWLWVSTWIRVRSCCWFLSDISDDCRDETTWPSWRPVRSVYSLVVQLTTSSLGYSVILSLYKNGIL